MIEEPKKDLEEYFHAKRDEFLAEINAKVSAGAEPEQFFDDAARLDLLTFVISHLPQATFDGLMHDFIKHCQHTKQMLENMSTNN